MAQVVDCAIRGAVGEGSNLNPDDVQDLRKTVADAIGGLFKDNRNLTSEVSNTSMKLEHQIKRIEQMVHRAESVLAQMTIAISRGGGWGGGGGGAGPRRYASGSGERNEQNSVLLEIFKENLRLRGIEIDENPPHRRGSGRIAGRRAGGVCRTPSDTRTHSHRRRHGSSAGGSERQRRRSPAAPPNAAFIRRDGTLASHGRRRSRSGYRFQTLTPKKSRHRMTPSSNPQERPMHQSNTSSESQAGPRIKPVHGKPILAAATSDVDTGKTEKAMLLGIDLGTSRSSDRLHERHAQDRRELRRLRPRTRSAARCSRPT